MKTRTFVSILIFVLSVLIISGSCSTTYKTRIKKRRLLYASTYGHTEIVKLLIEAGVYVNAQDREENTALMSASRMGHTEIVKLLREAGAEDKDLPLQGQLDLK